jgi:hypothetical protein
MVFPGHGNHFSKVFFIKKISHIGRDFGMIPSSKRLERSLRKNFMEVVRRNWLLLII